MSVSSNDAMAVAMLKPANVPEDSALVVACCANAWSTPDLGRKFSSAKKCAERENAKIGGREETRRTRSEKKPNANKKYEVSATAAPPHDAKGERSC